VEWQCKNEASIHRTAKDFTVDHVFTSGVNATAHWKHRPAEWLENITVYAVTNLSVDLDHQISGGLEKRKQIGVKLASIGL